MSDTSTEVVERLTNQRDYNRRLVEHQKTVIDRLNAERDALAADLAEARGTLDRIDVIAEVADAAPLCMGEIRELIKMNRALKSDPAPRPENIIRRDPKEAMVGIQNRYRKSMDILNEGCDAPRAVSVQEAAKVLLDAMDGSGPFGPFWVAADAMIADAQKGLGPIPQIGSMLRALAQKEKGDE